MAALTFERNRCSDSPGMAVHVPGTAVQCSPTWCTSTPSFAAPGVTLQLQDTERNDLLELLDGITDQRNIDELSSPCSFYPP